MNKYISLLCVVGVFVMALFLLTLSYSTRLDTETINHTPEPSMSFIGPREALQTKSDNVVAGKLNLQSN